MTDRVTCGRALSQLRLRVLITDGTRQTGFEGALSVREGIVHALFAHRVVFMVTVAEHALSYWTDCAVLAAACVVIEEVVVVADAHGIVGVRAGRLQPHQAGTLLARLTLLCVTVVLREGLTCRWRRRKTRR